MNFHERTTFIEIYKRLGMADEALLSRDELARAAHHGLVPRHVAAQLADEADWLAGRRPYYNVWPAIADALVRTPLDLAGDSIQLPLKPLVLRFGVGAELASHGRRVRSILVNETQILGEADSVRGLCLWVDYGETNLLFGRVIPIFTYRVFQLTGVTVEEGLAASRKRFDPMTDEEEQTVIDCIRVVLAVSLLDQGGEFFEADVLAKDAAKYRDDPRDEIVARAHRRGKIGWHVGRSLEFAPHIRRPHFAIRWMGHGPDKTPRLRPIKGSVVKRKRLTDVPTGFMDDT